MKLLTSIYRDNAWSEPLEPDLDSESTVVYVFGYPEFHNTGKVLEDIKSAYPKSHIVGCSTAGEIFNTQVLEKSISVAVAKFERTKIRSVFGKINSSDDSHAVGRQLAKQINAPDLKAAFILSEGLNINGTRLVKGMGEIFSHDIVKTGGLAGDGTNFKNTWVIKNGICETNTICIVGFYGNSIMVSSGSVGGWDVFGPERRVTSSEANVLFELDHKPALKIYKEYLGDKAKDLPGSALLFPLSLKSDSNGKDGLVRTILGVDEEKQSLTFAGDIPQGSITQLMHANFDRLVDGAARAAEMTNTKSWPNPILSIAISCVGRKLVLGERIEDETEAVLDILPPGTKQIGFYSYGEIAAGSMSTCDLHNQTMTLTVLSENN